MYDPAGSDTGREWVEIKNDTSGPIDISGYKFLESLSASNHSLTLIQGTALIPAGGFLIISNDTTKFFLDYPNFSGNLFKVSITSFNNSGNTVTLKDSNLNVVDTFIYSSAVGASDDGNSLQKISGSWSPATPTPGSTNDPVAPPSSSPPSNSSSSGNNTNPSVVATTGGNGEDPALKNNKKSQKIETKIIAKNFVFSGVPLELKVVSTGYYGEVLPYGKYYWNFGDGDSKQMTSNEMEKFSHIYFYPGEYSINLEYYMNYYGENPDAVDKFVVKVIAPSVVISSVGDEKDFYLEITNNGDYEADISKWILENNRTNFVFPKNTILGVKKKIIISPHISNFVFSDGDSLRLMTPQREVAYDYGSSLHKEETKDLVVQNTPSKVEKNSAKSISQLEILKNSKKNKINDAIDLTATVISGTENKNEHSFYFFGAVLSILIVFGSISVYFLRRKKNLQLAGEDFELLDE